MINTYKVMATRTIVAIDNEMFRIAWEVLRVDSFLEIVFI